MMNNSPQYSSDHILLCVKGNNWGRTSFVTSRITYFGWRLLSLLNRLLGQPARRTLPIGTVTGTKRSSEIEAGPGCKALLVRYCNGETAQRLMVGPVV